MTVYLISRLSINGHEYVTVFLDLQIFDDFEVKYLPLTKRYDTNCNVPLFIDHLSFETTVKTSSGFTDENCLDISVS